MKETLEEAAEIWVNNRFIKQRIDEDIYASKSSIIESHIIFAKWQQEQTISDVEIKEFTSNKSIFADDISRAFFILGAEWYREQLKTKWKI